MGFRKKITIRFKTITFTIFRLSGKLLLFTTIFLTRCYF